MKKKNYLFTAAIAGLFVASITSCKKEPATGTIAFQMSKSTANVSQRSTPSTLQFTSGHVIISEIEFEGDRKGKGDVSISHEQITKIDLATGVSTSPINIAIPAGVYSSVELEVEILDDDNTHPLAILAEGTYTDSNNKVIPIRFESNSDEEFEASTNAEVTIKPGTSPIANIVFDPLEWFSTITTAQLDNAKKNSNGVIVISENMNTDIYETVVDKLDDKTKIIFL